MSDDSFWGASKREGQLVGIDHLDDPTMMMKVFTAATPERRLGMLQNVQSHLAGKTFERSQARQVAKLADLRSKLEFRHRQLLRFGR
jgi:hypothetical protein